jgi:outer membrane protein
VEVKNREPGMISAENDAVLSMQDLKRILALEKEPDPVLSDTLFYRTLEVTEENAVKEALANRPDILALEQNVEGQEKLLSIRNAEKFPVLGLYGQVVFQGEAGRARPLDPFDSEHRAVSSAAGVALTIPLFDGFRTKGKIEQARADLRSARLQLEEETHSVRLETTKAVKELESLRRAYEAQVATVGLAEEAYRIAETRYQSGISTQLELTDARIALDEARTNYASTLYSYDVAVANLERILGRTTRDEVAPFTNGRGGEEE